MLKWAKKTNSKLSYLCKYRSNSYKNVYDISGMIYYGAVFVHIPKCGGVSVNRTVYNCLGGGHKTIKDYEEIFNDDFRSYWKFAFVRNPIDRFLSAYVFLVSGGFSSSDALVSKRLIEPYGDVNHFVEEGLDLAYKEIIHFKKQVSFLDTTKPNLGLDFIGKFERIAEDFEKVKLKLKLKNNLRFDNKSRTLTQRLSKTSKEKLRNLYSEDYQLLNY